MPSFGVHSCVPLVSKTRFRHTIAHERCCRALSLSSIVALLNLDPVGSQNRIRRKLQRYVMVNCRGVPSRRGTGQAMPPESSRKCCGGTACHVLFEGTFLAMRSVIQSERRSLRSGHRSPMTQAETAHASYAASRQE